MSLCGWIGISCSRAAVRIRSSEVSTHLATSGCSTSVSVEMTWIGFCSFGGRQLPDRQPDELERGARVFAAAVADDPGHVVGQVELADFVAHRLDASWRALIRERPIDDERDTCRSPL